MFAVSVGGKGLLAVGIAFTCEALSSRVTLLAQCSLRGERGGRSEKRYRLRHCRQAEEPLIIKEELPWPPEPARGMVCHPNSRKSKGIDRVI